MSYDQDALDAASREVHMMLLREGSNWGTKACEEMGRVFMTAYLKAAPAEVDATDAIDILRGLVALKDRKDSIGKDDTYEKMQPVLWQRARTFLEGL